MHPELFIVVLHLLPMRLHCRERLVFNLPTISNQQYLSVLVRFIIYVLYLKIIVLRHDV